jgi:hypothetical protein
VNFGSVRLTPAGVSAQLHAALQRVTALPEFRYAQQLRIESVKMEHWR